MQLNSTRAFHKLKDLKAFLRGFLRPDSALIEDHGVGGMSPLACFESWVPDVLQLWCETVQDART